MAKTVRIDFHAHILPGMDHGCKDVCMSVKQLELAAENGVDVVIASSHFYPHIHTVDGYIHKRKQAVKALRERISKKQLPKVVLGAEVLLYPNLNRMEGLERLCAGNSNILLAELPFAKSWDTKLIETADRIQKDTGLRVVLAHADRYSYDEVMRLVDKGIELQLNTASVCSLRKYRLCRKYIETGRVVALGSDIHGLSNAYMLYRRAIQRLGRTAEEILDTTAKMAEWKQMEALCGKGEYNRSGV